MRSNDEWELHKLDSEADKDKGKGVINARVTRIEEGSAISLLPPILSDHVQ